MLPRLLHQCQPTADQATRDLPMLPHSISTERLSSAGYTLGLVAPALATYRLPVEP